MNLWDIPAGEWSEPLLELAVGGGKEAAAELRRKLGEVRRDGGGSMGSIAAYFVGRHGFGADCQIAPFTGDNPASILALPLRPLDAMVSLGTSTTFLMITPHYEPDPSYHFLNHPTTPGQYMFMLCYKNGGLARERVRDALPSPPVGGGGDGDPWATFNRAVLDSPPLGMAADGSGRAKLGLYFYLNEIVAGHPRRHVALHVRRRRDRPGGGGARGRLGARGRRARHRRVAGALDAAALAQPRGQHAAGPAGPAAPHLPRRRRLAQPGHRARRR